jgi:hypothetical protein
MRLIDLTVVADPSCSTSRAYLTYLRAHGYRPRKVLVVDFAPVAPRPPLRHRVREALRNLLGRSAGSAHATPEAPAEDTLYRECCEEMQAGQALRVDYFGAFDYAAHAESVEHCRATGYGDPRFQALLRRQPGALLYTCGDRVPPSLADDPTLRILHIHPGVVPFVRGSDGLLWSLAVRGRPGASCFYMNSGIDTGAVIATLEFERPRFPRLASLLEDREPLLYRALLFSYDPHLRGQTLVQVLARNGGRDLRELPSAVQRPEEGRWWFAMHPRLRQKVFAERILC